MVSRNFAFLAVLAVAMLLLAGCAGTPGTPQSLVFQQNADTLTTTGTMNIGTPKDIYLSPDEMANIPVAGAQFANASGYLHVEINGSTKFCSYTMYRVQTGLGVPWEEYRAQSLTNDLTYNIRVTQPNGQVTSKSGISPFDLSQLNLPLAANPDRPGYPVYLKVQGQEATLGESSCDDRQSFVVLRWGGNTVALKASVYDGKMSTIGLDPLKLTASIYDIQSAFNDPSSTTRYNSPSETAMDVSGVSPNTGSIAKYNEPRLGSGQVIVSAPFWAYKTIIFGKVPEGQARVDSCTIAPAEQGQTTYISLIYTNVGDTSKFFYTYSGGDYGSAIAGSNSQVSVSSGSQRTESLPVVAQQVKDSANFIISIKGESGIETQASCNGVIKASGSGIQPQPTPTPTPVIPTAKCKFYEKAATTTVGGVNILGLNFGGTQNSVCVADFSLIGAGLAIFGFLIVVLGLMMMGKGDEDVGKMVALLGAFLLVCGFGMIFLQIIIDSSGELMWAGIGVALIAAVLAFGLWKLGIL